MKKTIIKIILVVMVLLTNINFSIAQTKTYTAENTPNRFVNVGNMKYAYRTIGKGEPLLLIQRLRAVMEDWDPLFLNSLSKKYQVIYFDYAGSGLSTGQVDTAMKGMSDQIVDLMEALHYDKYNILGWSMGGMIAQVMAIEYPQYVKKAILIGTTPPGSPETATASPEFQSVAFKPTYDWKDHQILFFTKDAVGEKAAKASLARIDTRMKPHNPACTPQSYMTQTKAIISWFSDAEKYFARLKEIKIPVLIANGNKDLAFPIIDSYLMLREIPESKLIIYPYSGHGFHHQYASDFSNEVFNFLKQ